MQVNSAHAGSRFTDLDNGSVKFMLHGYQNRARLKKIRRDVWVPATARTLRLPTRRHPASAGF